MTKAEAQSKLVNFARAEVGYLAQLGKDNKYARYLDAVKDFYNTPKNHYDWCDVFVDYCFCKCFGNETGRKMLYQPLKSLGAGVGYSANYFKVNNAFSKVPQIGSQIFFGQEHTGIVVDFNASYVYTIEGNTGGGDGKVMRHTYKRDSYLISGYGIPKWDLVASLPSKDVTAIAKEVIDGKWGNGLIRRKKLEAAGYDYDEIQDKVNELLKLKTIETVAKEVIRGEWGNGTERKKKLEAAGYNYAEVQKMVNYLLNK